MWNLRAVPDMFFNGWYPLLRIIVVGSMAYVGLVLFLRIIGKRTLAKLNAFDLVVTVALGSTLASTLLSRDVALLEGLLAFALLLLLQFVITWASVRWDAFQNVVKATPRLLVYQGQPLEDAMRSERITTEEVDAAVRQQGVPGLRAAFAVVLETDGSISVLAAGDPAKSAFGLGTVRGAPDPADRERGRRAAPSDEAGQGAED
ncbi:MAG TPA: YetF domain-containing protein [Longimicrobiales bacterium]|nr:YetF domain-containing protein [Longimicrobiales bacterium]